MSSRHTILLLLAVFVFLCICVDGAHAFGAGNIPSFAYMEGRAFRHGDIEDILAEMAKASGGSVLGGLLGKAGLGGGKFSPLDIKRVYFGNWLRDYSQAMDIAGLQKLQSQTIITLCMALGFLAHGYATKEFEVTEERLGVYLPVEHIDNPKGYGDGQDARTFHPKLRPPVDPAELDIDPRSGMKNYIANDDGFWDTSKAHVRRTLAQCISYGRRYRSSGQKDDQYEAFRLLGTALHTLEDYPAHSNFCELALVRLGHTQVFTHVGDGVRVHSPDGRSVAPIVTGTFGSSDFIHSLLGEAGDHLSEASVTDLNKAMENSYQRSRGGGGPSMELRQLFSLIPGGQGNDLSRDMDNVENIRAQAQGQGGGKRPEDMSPQELHATLWQILLFRDSVVKKIEKTIQRIPGLGPLIEKIMDGISVFVFTTLEPFLKPILKTATSGLQNASEGVINSHDQYEVFNDARASDPTHSFLSKDHFNLILNEPAGLVARTIVQHTVKLVVKAWGDDGMSPDSVAEEATACLFHPDFPSRMPVQGEMLATIAQWAEKQPRKVMDRLTKQAVRNHENIRLAGEGGAPESVGGFAQTQGLEFQNKIGGYLQGVPGVGQAASFLGKVNNTGNSREYPQGSQAPPAPAPAPSSYGGGHTSGGHPSGTAAEYYAQGSSGSHSDSSQYGGGGHPQSSYGGGSAGYGAPPGPPPPQQMSHQHSSHSHSQPPSFPGSGGGGGYSSPPPSFPGAAPTGGGYAPSYMPSPPPGGAGGYGSGPPPPMGFPGAQPHHHGGGPPPPMGFPDPSFPGGPPAHGGYAPSYGSSPPPQFPNANHGSNSGYPGQHHGHHGGW